MSGDTGEGQAAKAALRCSVGAGFATLLDSGFVSYTAPSVQESLGATPSDIQWYLSAYSLTFGLGLVPAGRLGDALGRRLLLIIGLSLFAVGVVVSASAPGILMLLVGRWVQGAGAGCISAQVLCLLQDHFRGAQRVRALGSYAAAGAAAALVGPPVAGAVLLLPEDLGWRLALLLPLPFTVAVIWVAARGLPRDDGRSASHDPRSLDLPGIAMLGAIVVLVTLPAIDPGLPLPVSSGIIGAAVALGLCLAWWERRYARRGLVPIFVPALMRSRGFVLGNVMASLWFGSVLTANTTLTIYLLDGVGFPALGLATLLLPAALARFVSARAASRTYTRWGSFTATLGTGLEALSLATLAVTVVLLDGTALIVTLVLLQVVTGVAGGIVEPPLRAITLSHAPAGMNGVAASFLQLTQRLAATFLVALGTGLLLAGGTTPEALVRVLLLGTALTAIASAATLLPSFRAGTA
ncbi:MFS transporter [Galactobacter sp.]|uniref:MFS transporter n=1 Tax=Galactobacter sp. TaxID=2676125 RepID=UPI0025C4D585|nr:MFS transporter [Galactobacter sp.]